MLFIVSLDKVIEPRALSPNTSAQSVELAALIQVLQLGKDKRFQRLPDSKYGFLILHAHVAIWKMQGMLTAKNSPIKLKELILLLEAVQLPSQIVIHWRGHQRDHF